MNLQWLRKIKAIVLKIKFSTVYSEDKNNYEPTYYYKIHKNV